MSTDYGYINARVRGMKTKLLGSEFFSEALEATDFRAFVSVLGQSRYMRELEEAQSRYQGLRAVDDAIEMRTRAVGAVKLVTGLALAPQTLARTGVGRGEHGFEIDLFGDF
ncbi:MAG: V-type ATPase subunit, partial [Deinococcales bacterium]